MDKTWLDGYVYGLSVEYNFIDVSNFVDIHIYLLKNIMQNNAHINLSNCKIIASVPAFPNHSSSHICKSDSINYLLQLHWRNCVEEIVKKVCDFTLGLEYCSMSSILWRVFDFNS